MEAAVEELTAITLQAAVGLERHRDSPPGSRARRRARNSASVAPMADGRGKPPPSEREPMCRYSIRTERLCSFDTNGADVSASM
jgi:hypothetical protein